MAEHFCVECRTPFLNAFPLDFEGRCSLCRLGLRGYDAAYTFGSYEETLRELIHLFKYGRIESLARPLAEMAMTAYPRHERFDLIVPMPMHWWRRWQRGFNQAALVASVIGKRTAIPVVNAVRRTRHTPRQAGLSSAERRRNVTGAFHVSRPERLRGQRILLVDDVLTTGATASACAAAIKRAGANYVAVFALARTDRRFHAETYRTTQSQQSLSLGAT